ncbi:MAG: class I SAM-dependent methyltransferase [Gemmatimonadetes bacterium]|nr:class I SAM-dependent methyltransferase [Gemmatimonadota bacterium]
MTPPTVAPAAPTAPHANAGGPAAEPWKVALAKRTMRLMERHPAESDLALAQVFRTERFRNAAPEERLAIMEASSRYREEYEDVLPFERHFDRDLRPYIEGKRMLDLGCFTGGRSVAWHKRFGARKTYGVDIDPVFVEAARHWAAVRNVDAEFCVGTGESLPFADASVDAVVSFDVFEHVQDVRQTLAECFRVLAPSGVLIAVFPPFYCPTEHHLSGATRTPALHWVFSGEVLYQAYREIVGDRPGSGWYLPGSERLASWERLYTLNGCTVKGWLDSVRDRRWTVEYQDLLPWPASTRLFYTRPWLRSVWRGMGVTTRIPGLRELATDRICTILRKPA